MLSSIGLACSGLVAVLVAGLVAACDSGGSDDRGTADTGVRGPTPDGGAGGGQGNTGADAGVRHGHARRRLQHRRLRRRPGVHRDPVRGGPRHLPAPVRPAAAAPCGAGETCLGLQSGGGVCLPTGTADYGAACHETAAPRCTGDLLCLPTSDQGSTCREVCDPAMPQGCTGGRECVTQQGQTVGLCLAPGAQRTGDACDALDQRCAAGNRCVAESADDPATCVATCNPAMANTCAGGDVCTQVSATTAFCLSAGTRQAGEMCGFLDQRCADAFLCVADSADRHTCHERCDDMAANPACPAMQACEAAADHGGVCVAVGTVMEGGECGNGSRCAGDLLCVAEDTATCRAGCDLCGELTTACDAGRECVPIDEARGACIPSESDVGVGQACPTARAARACCATTRPATPAGRSACSRATRRAGPGRARRASRSRRTAPSAPAADASGVPREAGAALQQDHHARDEPRHQGDGPRDQHEHADEGEEQRRGDRNPADGRLRARERLARPLG